MGVGLAAVRSFGICVEVAPTFRSEYAVLTWRSALRRAGQCQCGPGEGFRYRHEGRPYGVLMPSPLLGEKVARGRRTHQPGRAG